MTTQWYPALCSALVLGCGGITDIENADTGGNSGIDSGIPSAATGGSGSSAVPVYGMLVNSGGTGGASEVPTGGRWGSAYGTGGRPPASGGIDTGVPTGGRLSTGGWAHAYGITGGRANTGGMATTGGNDAGGFVMDMPTTGGARCIYGCNFNTGGGLLTSVESGGKSAAGDIDASTPNASSTETLGGTSGS